MAMGATPDDMDEKVAWGGVLAICRRFRTAPSSEGWSLVIGPDGVMVADIGVASQRCAVATVRRCGTVEIESVVPDTVAAMFRLYLPLCARPGDFTVGHLGQSLDGKIATVNGASHYVTGPRDIEHNHRMRALFDAVLVGSETVLNDNPQLTVRHCGGENPVRVVIDTERRLSDDYFVFQDNAARTILICAEDMIDGAESHGSAELLGLPRCATGLAPRQLRDLLAARGYQRLFVEGGGITVSRFLEAKCLDRLQVTVSPMIIGSGRSAITLPEVASIAEGLRPETRRFEFGDDVMFECLFDG
jgi:diaminohydroxyphosphoribosylaminopyrimidine deaminase/5-amino-6-(5-phosphoribosylamino)uracil reductase